VSCALKLISTFLFLFEYEIKETIKYRGAFHY
jgi:hypothetical protein